MPNHDRIDPRRGPGRERDDSRQEIDAGIAEYEEDRDAKRDSLFDFCDDWSFDFDEDWMDDPRDDAYDAHEPDDNDTYVAAKGSRVPAPSTPTESEGS